jgi:TPR repeat protein
LPVDAALAREPDLRYETFDIQEVLDEMDAPGRVNLVFLDACRDNPFALKLTGSPGSRSVKIGQGLAEVQTQTAGSLIAYATAPGTLARDGVGKNSPFTAALVRHLTDQGSDVRKVLQQVRSEVQAASNGSQRPWVTESLDADFYFVPPVSQPPAPPPQIALQTPDQPGHAPAQQKPAGDPASPEVVFWQSIEKSTDPADFEAYLQQFPNGVFSRLARVRLIALTKAAPAVQPPAQVPDADETSWSEADRRAAQTALTVLGDYRGPINGGFASNMRPAVLHWQDFEGLQTTGHLSIEQRDRLLREAELQTGLLKVPAKSPRGKWYNSVKGPEERFNRGVESEQGAGQPKDPAEAAYWYALSAADEWRGAFTNLGMLYALGQGVRQDMQAAKRLWLTAATLGDGTAMFNLGALAETGFGGQPADLAEAKRWYSRGAESNHPDSVAALKRLGG